MKWKRPCKSDGRYDYDKNSLKVFSQSNVSSEIGGSPEIKAGLSL